MFSSQKAVSRTWEAGKMKFHVPRQMGSFWSVCSSWMPRQPLHAAQLFCGRMLRKVVPACRKYMLLPGILTAWVITVCSPDHTPSKALPIGLAMPSSLFVAGNGTSAAMEAQWCAPGRANPCQVLLKKNPKAKRNELKQKNTYSFSASLACFFFPFFFFFFKHMKIILFQY